MADSGIKIEKIEVLLDPESEFLASNRDTGNEWELFKENVRPLKRGRKVEILNDALKAQTDNQLKKFLFEQRRRLVQAIDEYEGDDPLHPWLECIKWVQEAFPPGGDISGLVVIYEQCVRTFWHSDRYRDDFHYLKVWLEYVSSSPFHQMCISRGYNIGIQFTVQFVRAKTVRVFSFLSFFRSLTPLSLCRSHSLDLSNHECKPCNSNNMFITPTTCLYIYLDFGSCSLSYYCHFHLRRCSLSTLTSFALATISDYSLHLGRPSKLIVDQSLKLYRSRLLLFFKFEVKTKKYSAVVQVVKCLEERTKL